MSNSIEHCAPKNTSLYSAMAELCKKMNEIIDVLNLINPEIPRVFSVNNRTGHVVLNYKDVGALSESYEAPVTSVNGETGAVQLDLTGAVKSVNGKTGAVQLDAAGVGALPSTYEAPVKSVNGMTGDVTISSGIGAVESVNGKVGKVTLNANDVGALPKNYTPPVTSVNGETGAVQLDLTGAVKSVNGKTGAVQLDAAGVGALPSTYEAPVKSVNGMTGDVTISSGTGATIDGPFTWTTDNKNSKSHRITFNDANVNDYEIVFFRYALNNYDNYIRVDFSDGVNRIYTTVTPASGEGLYSSLATLNDPGDYIDIESQSAITIMHPRRWFGIKKKA